jgi:glycosyltransferase involved in cell wall biosynthesis
VCPEPILSVVVPFYNEKQALPATVESLLGATKSLDSEVEILLVDDGSTDGSAEGLQLPPGVRLIRHHRNRGYGRAIATGLSHATGKWIAIIDADGTYSVEDLKRLWEKRHDADMVVGERAKTDARSRRFVKWFLRRLAETLSGERIPDLNSGLRLFRRDLALAYQGLLPDGFSLTTTLTLAFLCHGHRVFYHPIEYHPRVGRSKIRPIADTSNFLSLIIRMILFFNPLKVLLPLSFSFLVLATGLLFFSKLVLGELMDVTVTVLYMLAVQIALLGFLADLIVRRSR